MTHLPFTILAYFLNSVSVTVNKFLLQKSIPDPFLYTFYITLFSLIILIALPFTNVPSLYVYSLTSISTIFWTLGAYFMFKALKLGKLSRVIPVIGTLIPLILLFAASKTADIPPIQSLAVVILVLGLIVITFFDWEGKIGKNELIFEILSAFLFALSYLILREAYLLENFLTVLVWSRIVLIPLIILVLLIPLLRKRVIPEKASGIRIFTKSGLLLLLGQSSGGVSELLLLYSVSLANPALVNSLQGTQYIFILFFSFFLKEKYSAIQLLIKFFGIILIGIGLYLLAS